MSLLLTLCRLSGSPWEEAGLAGGSAGWIFLGSDEVAATLYSAILWLTDLAIIMLLSLPTTFFYMSSFHPLDLSPFPDLPQGAPLQSSRALTTGGGLWLVLLDPSLQVDILVVS